MDFYKQMMGFREISKRLQHTSSNADSQMENF